MAGAVQPVQEAAALPLADAMVRRRRAMAGFLSLGSLAPGSTGAF